MLELWHQRFGHENFKQVAKVSKLEVIEGLPKFGKVEKTICGACQMGKQTKASHHKVNVIATSHCLELLHVDLIGPTRTKSLGGKRYITVIVDDFLRYTWVEFLREKSKACENLKILCKRLQNEKGAPIVKIRSDHGKEFENARFESFYEKNVIKKEFSAPKTPQQNGVVERNNWVIQEIARVMLLNKNISQKFWGEAVNTSCHIGNRIFFQAGTKKIAYEIWNGKKPKVKYFRVFRSKFYILNDRENLKKFDAKSDEGIFLGYSTTSRAYKVFNKRTKTVMKSINVEIDDAITKVEIENDGEGPSSKGPTVEIEAQDIEGKGLTPEKESTPVNSRMEIKSMSRTSSPLTPLEVHPPISRNDEVSTSKKLSSRMIKNHPNSNNIGPLDEGIRLRKGNILLANHVTYHCYLAQFEPKMVEKALQDENWVESMHEEHNQFVRNDVWELVPRPENVYVIGTKWIFKNKTDEDGEIIRNKSWLVAQGYTQVDEVDFDESFAPVAMLESIRILMSIACTMNFKLYQMDVKCAFLNGYLNEEVFVKQPKGFQDSHFPDHVLRLKKALYGLK